MTIFTDNSIALARQQEQQKFPRILVYGVGGSLVLHGVVAVALNFLPQPMPTPVEVTLIDPSELPPDFRPSPEPSKVKPTKDKAIAKVTPTPTPSVKITSTPTPTPAPTPSVKITPTPTLTPSVKITPTPTPTPSVKITSTPTPTPSVKITPTPTPTPSIKSKQDQTPQIVKIVRKPTADDLKKDQNLANNPFPKNSDQQSRSGTNSSKKQEPVNNPKQNSRQNPEASSLSGVNSSSLNNNRLSLRDLSRSAEAGGLFGNQPNSSAGAIQNEDQLNNDSPGNSNNSRAANPGNLATINTDKTAGSNGQSLSAGRTSRSSDAFRGNSGSAFSEDGSELAFNSPGGLGGNPGAGSLGNSGNGLPLAPTGTGKFGGGSGNGGVVGSDSDGFSIELSPGSGNISRSQSISGGKSTSGVNTRNNGNGRPLAPTGTGKFSSGSNGNSAGGNGGEDGNGFSAALSPGSSSGSRSRSVFGGESTAETDKGLGNSELAYGQTGRSGRGLGNSSGSASGNDFGNGSDERSLGESNPGSPGRSRSSGIIGSSQGFGTGLECLDNCKNLEHSERLDRDILISANITLNDTGKVIEVKILNLSENTRLNHFAENAFGKMKFKLPATVKKRIFSAQLNFKQNISAQ